MGAFYKIYRNVFLIFFRNHEIHVKQEDNKSKIKVKQRFY